MWQHKKTQPNFNYTTITDRLRTYDRSLFLYLKRKFFLRQNLEIYILSLTCLTKPDNNWKIARLLHPYHTSTFIKLVWQNDKGEWMVSPNALKMCTENFYIFTSFDQNTTEFYDNHILLTMIWQCIMWLEFELKPPYVVLHVTDNGKCF